MKNAIWIHAPRRSEHDAPIFRKTFAVTGSVEKATLFITARGVYEAHINGRRVGDAWLTPGWTSYEKRLQVQEQDVTHLLTVENTIRVQLADGWYLGKIATLDGAEPKAIPPAVRQRETGILAALHLQYADGRREEIVTDDSWEVLEGSLRFCDIYDGVRWDATVAETVLANAGRCRDQQKGMLIPAEGVETIAQEIVRPCAILKTPAGETVVDFGQNLTGVPEISVTAKSGERIAFSFAEILDQDGNFYNRNYRTARCEYTYICKEGEQTWRPTLTFYGFRYLRVDAFPGEITADNVRAIVLHSNIRKTGAITTSSPLLNRLIRNIFWGQKGNFLDVPTDCPQRDERFGWTGDAQVFARTASYNYDARNFFRKWLRDMKADQLESGEVPAIIPAIRVIGSGAGWGDVITICPWQMYLTYGDREILREMFPAMKKWVDFITGDTTTAGLWTGRWQWGDWLELSAPYGEMKGQTRDDLVASAYYAYSTAILCKAGRVIGEDVAAYEDLYNTIVNTYRETFRDTFETQTEHILTLYFGLTDRPQDVAASLVDRIAKDGNKIQTGFLGTPYILHVLSQYGYADLAYELLLREEYPSWLYPVTKGATTIWEHWDGIMPDGRIWPDNMNSYNHYAYGSVADWMYGVAAGIHPVEDAPGFERILFTPTPTHRLSEFAASIKTACGTVSSRWWHEGDRVRYEIVTPSPATAVIDRKTYTLAPGTYLF